VGGVGGLYFVSRGCVVVLCVAGAVLDSLVSVVSREGRGVPLLLQCL